MSAKIHAVVRWVVTSCSLVGMY